MHMTHGVPRPAPLCALHRYNDDNMQGLLGTDNREKSNHLPSVPELAACRNTWPLHWGDVLPAAIPCPRAYEYLRKARPLAQQTFYDPPVSGIRAHQLRVYAGLPRPRLWC